ncbi:Peptidase, M48 family [Desulfonema limicola]|uniref:Peptidase, M48 family n=1 Tax=Desulfonema limicola TaxID=45656 RepID=A0A975B7T6_9BACT|nr:M48 family metallopeptidase [Desulfonema limicola]QTA80539.1 Peptidase, M48 family [Desulfonema limicola]
MLKDIESLRFSYESRLFRAIGSRLGHIPLIDYACSRQLLDTRRRDLLGDAVRVTPDLLPGIHKEYQSCLDMLGGGFTGDLFVQQSSFYNASVFAHDKKFDILIHSALLNDFTPDELRFVFGHELGHVIFKHYLFPVRDIIAQVKNHDPEAASLLFRWSRASEISADRVGMLCCSQLGAAATALFRTSSGLSNIDVNKVLQSFRCQYLDLENQLLFVNNTDAWVRTHPMIPIRFKALELAALDIIALSRKTGGFSTKGFRKIDEQIALILEKIDSCSNRSNMS